MIQFDRSAPGEGAELILHPQNGRVEVDFHFHYRSGSDGSGCVVRVRLCDREGFLTLEAVQQADEEEQLRGVLLHPRVWQSVEDPYLYRLEAVIIGADGQINDTVVRALAIYELREHPQKGWLLNGEPFSFRTVVYEPAADTTREQLLQELLLLRGMGANSVYMEREKPDGPTAQLCGELGLLVPDSSMLSKEQLPVWRRDGSFVTLYYRYLAEWGKRPFVYIVPESIRRQENGSYTVTVYSSCAKVAMYSDGILQEFQSGKTEFIFREVTAKGPCLALTAETEECVCSFSVHKTFTKSSRFHDI